MGFSCTSGESRRPEHFVEADTSRVTRSIKFVVSSLNAVPETGRRQTLDTRRSAGRPPSPEYKGTPVPSRGAHRQTPRPYTPCVTSEETRRRWNRLSPLQSLSLRLRGWVHRLPSCRSPSSLSKKSCGRYTTSLVSLLFKGTVGL